MQRWARHAVAGLASLALVAGAGTPVAAVDGGPLQVPETITALGDSITAGVHVNRLLVTEPAYSWSTGTNDTVQSLYERLDPLEAGAMTARNLSKSGAKAADLPGQASAVKGTRGTDLVTILIGANDACTSTVGAMTSVAAFKASIDSALKTLKKKGVEQVAIASIPDIYQLWSVYKDSSTARFIWGLYGICQSMLANPTSTSTADVARRQAVDQRVRDFNAALAAACTTAAVACRFDGNAVFGTLFTTADVSTADYFHPSPSGQYKLAAAAFGAFGPFTPSA